MEDFERILIPLDGSTHSDRAVGKALSLAQLLKRPVLGVYVIDERALEPYPSENLVVDLRGILDKEARRVLEDFLRQADGLGVKAETRVLEGVPEDEIVKAAHPRDLIVMATHGRRGLTRLLLGSVAENVARHAPCPVLLVRQREG